MENSPDLTIPPPALRLPRWDVRIAGALFLTWIVLARTGPMLELAPGVRAWYPPAALVAAACLLWGLPALVPIVAASSLMVVLADRGPEPLARVLAVSAGLKLVYWAAARVLRRLDFDLRFSRPADVARFGFAFVAAGGLAALLNTIDDVGLAGVLTPESRLLLRGFWIGDVVAVVALAPALIVAVQWVSHASAATLRVTLARLRGPWSAAAMIQLVSLPLALLASASLAPSIGFFAFALCFLPLGWIALTHGARVAALANAVLTIGTVSLLHGGAAVVPKALEMQAFLGIFALTSLLVGSVADDRERAFALLGESEERYRRLVELLPDPLVVHVRGRIVFANSAAARVLGAPEGKGLAGISLADLATARSRDAIVERTRRLSEGNAVELTHHSLNRCDGTGTVELESVSIPFTYQGTPAALTVARDISSRVRLEEELRHAQRMEAVGRLAGGVAHDFNNLLTVIISYSELLIAQTSDQPALTRDVGEIRNAADRASALTRQLLSFSRRQVLQPTQLEVNAVVRGAEALLRRLIGPEIAIVARLDPAAGMVYADRGQLEQVIMNLVVNARDAMADGGTLTVETGMVAAEDAPAGARAASPAPRFATIVVRDTGKGMDADTMRRIFDPFFTTKEIGRGTGLGLATVHGIIQQSGGAITVDSELGKGSEFRILLPALTDAAVPAVATGEAMPVSRGRGRVLLVEDDAAVREGVRRMLRTSGYETVEVSDGVEAMAALDARDGEFEAMLSDIAMPAMDGRQLARDARARWPALPIVLMSGFADPAAVERDIPGVTLLQKPLDVATLVCAIETAVSER